MKRCFLVVVVLLSLLGAQGCALVGYRAVRLHSELINDNNKVLTLEGESNLPDGTPLIAEITERGKSIMRSRTAVDKGRYFFTFDISALLGTVNYNLDIYSEPSLWSQKQARILGDCGQYMTGAQVEERGAVFRVAEHYLVALPMSERDNAIRCVRSGDYATAAATLENFVASDVGKNDLEAQAWLALALAYNSSAERHSDSRACSMLRQIRLDGLPADLRQQCQVWLRRWQSEDEANLSRQRYQQELAHSRERARAELAEFTPGSRMADISLGDPAQQVFNLYPSALPVDMFRANTAYNIPERQIEVSFDDKNRVVAICTHSPQLRWRGRLGVGAELAEVQRAFPGGLLSWEMEEAPTAGDKALALSSTADNDYSGKDRITTDGSTAEDTGDMPLTKVVVGQYVHSDGVIFGIRRLVFSVGINLDKVAYVKIVAKN